VRIGRRAFSIIGLVSCTRHVAPSSASAGSPLPVSAVSPTPIGPPLFDAHPALRALPYRKLGALPTPVERSALGASLGMRSLWLKRDDASGTVYGGGKTRKLELLLADALERKCSGVATMGGMGSNHALATALYARTLGLAARLVLLPEPASAEASEHVRAERAAGAAIVMGSSQAAAESLARTTWPDESLAWIPAGGTSPLGNIGFVNAGFELAAQIRAGALPEPHLIYMAMGTMGSAVGLSIGLRAAGIESRVVAVRASTPPTSSTVKLHAAQYETIRFLRAIDPTFPELGPDDDALRIDGTHLGAGYAVATPDGDAATALALRSSLVLEHVYTAKAFAALVHDARANADRDVLFWVSNDPRRLT
jgi:D-cysteine desulfhydrase